MTNITNKILDELMHLEQQSKIIDARITEIRSACKDAGSFSTSKYVCAVTTQTRTGLASLALVETALGRQILEQHNLIKTTEYKTIKVCPKL